MPGFKTYNYPGIGEWANETMSYSQAIRVENRIVCSGQGGWDRTTGAIATEIAAEVDQAFENVEANLRHAGGKGWSQVYRIATYSTDIKATHEHVVRNLRKWAVPGRQPAWTEVGVRELGLETMRFEIEVEALDPEGASAAAAAAAKE